MVNTIQLEEELLSLPHDERARLAKSLLESLHDEPEHPDSDADTLWREELERRAADAREHPHDLVEASELHHRLEARIRRR